MQPLIDVRTNGAAGDPELDEVEGRALGLPVSLIRMSTDRVGGSRSSPAPVPGDVRRPSGRGAVHRRRRDVRGAGWAGLCRAGLHAAPVREDRRGSAGDDERARQRRLRHGVARRSLRRRWAIPASRSATWTRGSSRRVDLPERAHRCGRTAGTAWWRNVPNRVTRPRVSALCSSSCTTATDPCSGAPEQQRLGECGHQRLQRWWECRIAVDQPGHHPLDPRGASGPRSAATSDGHRRDEPVDRVAVDHPEPLRPARSRRTPRGTPGGPPQRAHGSGVVSAQARARPVRRFLREQLEHPRGDERRLVGHVDVRTTAERREEPLQSRTLAAAAAGRTCTRTDRRAETAARRPRRRPRAPTRSVLAWTSTGERGSRRLLPENPDSSHAISTHDEEMVMG